MEKKRTFTYFGRVLPKIARAFIYPLVTVVMAISPAVVSAQSNRSSFVSPSRTLYEKQFKSNGKTYTMYYINPSKESNPENICVTEVYFVPEGFIVMNPYHESTDRNAPPRMIGLRYHDLGPGKEFVGAVVDEKRYDNSAKTVYYYEMEIRLPENISDELMDLYKGRTRFTIGSRGTIARMFKNLETTNSPSLLPEKLTQTSKM